MMGNQRQVLKDNIEKELVAKIETAKDVLTRLSTSLETNKQNALSAKEEIRTTSDAMKDVLTQRKKELLQEVDNLHSIQVRSLQDAIRSTYITMGKLQSILSNLDYFDQSQLVDLQIPHLNTVYTLTEPAQINVASEECDQIKEELREWGNISTDGFQCCMLDAMSFAPPSTSNADKENQKLPPKITAVCDSCPWRSLGIDKWLKNGNSSRKNSMAASDKDDFFLVSSPFSESCDMEFVATVPDLEDISSNLIGSQLNDIEDSGSSIICVGKDTVERSSDLSAWLKPGKSFKCSQANNMAPKYNSVMLCSDTSKFLCSAKRNVNSAEKRTLDFPCLKMDAETWIHQKKSKSTGSVSSEKTSSSVLSCEQKLIPPAYALPNPFWLKKYQHKR